MPLARYFGFVGTALLILLLGVSWLVSEPVPEVASNDINKPVIRISSIEKLPERVIFDTSLPPTRPPSAVMVAAQPVRSAFEFVQITPGPLPAIIPARLPVIAMTDEVTPRGPKIVKRDPSKKLIRSSVSATGGCSTHAFCTGKGASHEAVSDRRNQEPFRARSFLISTPNFRNGRAVIVRVIDRVHSSMDASWTLLWPRRKRW